MLPISFKLLRRLQGLCGRGIQAFCGHATSSSTWVFGGLTSRGKAADQKPQVGGEYDPSNHRYDHHQRGFEEVYDKDHKTKLSSAGLIYKSAASPRCSSGS